MTALRVGTWWNGELRSLVRRVGRSPERPGRDDHAVVVGNDATDIRSLLSRSTQPYMFAEDADPSIWWVSSVVNGGTGRGEA